MIVFAAQLWTGTTFTTVSSMNVGRQGLELLPLPANACIGSVCVGSNGGAIAIGVCSAIGGPLTAAVLEPGYFCARVAVVAAGIRICAKHASVDPCVMTLFCAVGPFLEEFSS